MLMIDELKQTRVYQDALEEGRQEGRQEGQCAVILKLLAKRLDRLTEASIGRVESLSGDQLDALSDRLLEISTAEELNDYLSDIASEQQPEQ